MIISLTGYCLSVTLNSLISTRRSTGCDMDTPPLASKIIAEASTKPLGPTLALQSPSFTKLKKSIGASSASCFLPRTSSKEENPMLSWRLLQRASTSKRRTVTSHRKKVWSMESQGRPRSSKRILGVSKSSRSILSWPPIRNSRSGSCRATTRARH